MIKVCFLQNTYNHISFILVLNRASFVKPLFQMQCSHACSCGQIFFSGSFKRDYYGWDIIYILNIYLLVINKNYILFLQAISP